MDQSIIDISMDYGYENIRTFNRNFKKLYGITPTDFKETLNKVDGYGMHWREIK